MPDPAPRIEQAVEQCTGMELLDWQRRFLRAALGTQQPGPREPLPVTEAVTETCACHCWANHPDRPGVCTAASQPGREVGGQPVCEDCHRATAASARTVNAEQGIVAAVTVHEDGRTWRCFPGQD